MSSSTKLSQYRVRIRELLRKIIRLASKCAHTDPLVKGSPGEVFQACGKENCKCSTHSKHKHGFYLVVQVYQDGKQRQIPYCSSSWYGRNTSSKTQTDYGSTKGGKVKKRLLKFLLPVSCNTYMIFTCTSPTNFLRQDLKWAINSQI